MGNEPNLVDIVGAIVTACIPPERSQLGRAALWEPRVPVPYVGQVVPEILAMAGKSIEFGGVKIHSLSSEKHGLVLKGSGLGGEVTWTWRHSELTAGMFSGKWAPVPMHDPWEVRVDPVPNLLPSIKVGAKPETASVQLATPIHFRVSTGWIIRKLTTLSVSGFSVTRTWARPNMSGLPSWLVCPVAVWQDAPARVATLLGSESTTAKDRVSDLLHEYVSECRRRRLTLTVTGATNHVKSGLSPILYLQVALLLADLIVEFFKLQADHE